MKWLMLALLTFSLSPLAQAEAPKFKPVTGDRIVFLGSTLVERDQTHSYFESSLILRFRDANFTFRNLGWSGDTVWGEARSGFGPQKEGYANLLKQVNECKPTILLINYGFNESFEGQGGLQHFIDGYNALLDDLSKTNAKIWLIGPQRHEDLGRPLPDPALHNQQLKFYTDAIAQIAAKRGCGFVDLYALIPADQHLTDNGIHLKPEGSRQLGPTLVTALAGVDTIPPLSEAFEQLRAAVIRKNQEYFYRWRPQNETYIFGFRKHEQGQNAVEIPQFDPIVQKLEATINELKKSVVMEK